MQKGFFDSILSRPVGQLDEWKILDYIEPLVLLHHKRRLQPLDYVMAFQTELI